MTIKHHIDDATLMSLSSGTLGEALTAVAAAHISLCAKCRYRLSEMDLIGGAMLANIEPNALNNSAKAVAQLAKSNLQAKTLPKSGETKAKNSCPNDLPSPISQMLGKPLSDIPWKWIAPGIATHSIKLSDHTTGDLRLLKVAPNHKLPEHGHSGGELTLIIKGAYRDKFGVFGPGDIADMDEHVEHQPIVEPGEDCICVVAFEAPAKFKNPIARILQPLIGM